MASVCIARVACITTGDGWGLLSLCMCNVSASVDTWLEVHICVSVCVGGWGKSVYILCGRYT